MTIAVELKKEGIQVIRPLDTLTINSIAKTVSEKLVQAFPEQNLNSQELFIKLSRLNMYFAKMPSGLSKAKYYYRNKTIYFDENLDLSSNSTYSIHECLHFLQELRDEKDNLIRLGLCDFTSSRLPGIALNEAAVQLMSSKALQMQADSVKYFDITLPTYSPFHYALECNLIHQMAYITGDYVLYNSTLYSNTSFEDKFIALTNKHAFHKIQKNMDRLMDLEDELSFESSKLENIEDTDKAISKIIFRINDLRNTIGQQFLETQNLILTSYFESYFKQIESIEQIDVYRKKLYSYKDLIGSADNYTFFNDYYIEKMAALENRRMELENALYNKDSEVSLTIVKHNFFTDFFKKLKRLVVGNIAYDEKVNQTISNNSK